MAFWILTFQIKINAVFIAVNSEDILCEISQAKYHTCRGVHRLTETQTQTIVMIKNNYTFTSLRIIKYQSLE